MPPLVLVYLTYMLMGCISRYFEAETNPRIKHTKKGLISMVNCGDNMVGSQFFFTLGKRVY
jgi:peptidyl-prolyl cis-trans isomerase-like 4